MFNERIFTLGPKAPKRKFFVKKKFRVKKWLSTDKNKFGPQKYCKSHNRTLRLIQTPKTFSFTVSSESSLMTSY